MGNILMVPVQLDALFLPTEKMVVGETADFSKLPHVSQEGYDIHPNNPYISEEIVSKPFQNTNFLLQKGLHLHWSLPDALTQGREVNAETVFPDLPNRWMIRKCKDGVEVEKWVVLSDYLWDDGFGEGKVCIPYAPDPANGNYKPYRFLGRCLSFAEYDPARAYPSYPNLNVLGYGIPTFAAFYPNCHSVFGFQDPTIVQESDLSGLTYELIGWYGDQTNDFLKMQIDEFANNGNPTDTKIWDFIQDRLKWNPDDAAGTAPEEMICYSRIGFSTNPNTGFAAKTINHVSVGITGTEALSAYLGQTLSSDHGAGEEEKRKIEDQMEALLMGSRIGNQLDMGARFKQLRHEQGFLSEDGGSYWIINKEGDAIIEDDTADQLWDEMREVLSEVNTLQAQYDAAVIELNSKKEQLYADWYKYMICAYPPENASDSTYDIDDVKQFIEEKGLNPLSRRQAQIFGTQDPGSPKALVEFLAEKINLLDSYLTGLNDHLASVVQANNADPNATKPITAPRFSLAKKPRPRFWKPRDPVILAVGDALEASNRFGRDGIGQLDGCLPCIIWQTNDTVSNLMAAKNATAFFNQLNNIGTGSDPGFNSWSEQPWNPLLLEWKAQLFPVKNEGNMRQDALDFETTFLTDNFQLKENDPDVSFRASAGGFVPSASIYTGSSILTANAGKQMKETLKASINKHVMEECLGKEGQGYFEHNAISPSEGYIDEIHNSIKNVSLVITWYEEIKNWDANTVAEDKIEDLTYITLKAYQKLIDPQFHSLSQALGGFNDSLLMRKESLELRIKDPLAFPEYQSFTHEVAATVGGASRRAPLPQNDFNPLRAGKLWLKNLRLVDSFGQSTELDIGQGLLTTEYLEAPGGLNQVLLRPRFLQAARVHFRWLAAQVAEEESNEFRHYNPICGWVMANQLDNSLMMFDASGKALGAFTSSDNDWKPAPGTDPASPINNPHLQQMWQYFQDRSVETDSGGNNIDFLSDFLEALNSAVDNIQPDSFAQHRSMAQLVGRPLALVRASLDLVLKEPPAIHQGWEVFIQDMNRASRETSEFTQVQFPIRIGEYNQLNDGVAGYWVEKQDGTGTYEGNIFHSPSANVVDSSYIETHADQSSHVGDSSHESHDPVIQLQTLDDDPMIVSLLFDPRGKVNLTTGLLPAKTIDIPPKLYMEAMDQMELYFVSSPHLITPAGLQFDLPPQAGYEWSFFRKDNQLGWVEETVQANIPAQDLFPGEKRILEGWLKLKKKPANPS